MAQDINHTKIFGIFNKIAIPEGATPVMDFEIERYLGRWYEIARMDFYWENENLDNVYAEYSVDEDTKEGFVKVKNTGYNKLKEKWQSFEGRAKFRTDNTIAALDVSFFGPTWSGYNVISVDEDYQYALVFGRNTDYIWFLSRDTGMPQEIKEKYKHLAQAFDYDISKLNYTRQDLNHEEIHGRI